MSAPSEPSVPPPRYINPERVYCYTCQADIGEPCTTTAEVGRVRLDRHHQARIEKAREFYGEFVLADSIAAELKRTHAKSELSTQKWWWEW